MHKSILALALSAAFLLAPTPAEAAKPKRERRGGERLLARFDRDHNGSLDTQESERVKKAFAALKSLDTDKNGELSDSEIGAAKIAQPQKGKKKQKQAN